MNRYDPLRTPDPAQWLELDESERTRLVQQYHRRARIRLPNATLHAVFHVVVENQVAEGTETPVLETLARLMSAGLDRHQANRERVGRACVRDHKGDSGQGGPEPCLP